jgi:hypothetical protein
MAWVVAGGALVALGLLCIVARDKLDDWNRRGSRRLAGSNWDRDRHERGEYRPYIIACAAALVASGLGLLVYGLIA